MVKSKRTRSIRLATMAILMAVASIAAAGVIPTPGASAATGISPEFRSRLASDAKAGSVVASAEAPLGTTIRTAPRTATAPNPTAPAIKPAAAKKTAANNKSVSRPAKKTTPKSGSTSSPASKSKPSSQNELARARSILAGYISRYPALAGTTVTFGDARGHQAICYYRSGRIVISPSHTASLERIIGHEIWHILDWRDNGVIDWGENVPPR